MFKHVLGQAFFQLIILMIVVMTGESWLPEYEDDFDDLIATKISASATITDTSGNTIPWAYTFKYNSAPGGSSDLTMRSGRPFDIAGDEDYWQELTDTVTPSRHYTFCFNLFVMLQIINFFNSRMLLDELNVFSRLHKSIVFIEIVLAILIL